MSTQSSSPHRIRRQSIPEALTESLRERILNGEFKEGDALIQDVIAQEYDTSRMPVREALRLLEAAGLVVMKLHKGAVVTSLSTEQIGELFDLRAILECDILARAIPNLTEQHLAGAQEILKALASAYQHRDVASWGRLNWEFHRALYVAADRVHTLATIQAINLQTDRYIRLHLLLTNAIDEAEQEHSHLLGLCAARDAERAVPYLEEHIQSVRRALLTTLEKDRRSQVVE